MINKSYIEVATKIVNEIERRKNASFPTIVKMKMTVDIASDMAANRVKGAVIKGNGEPITINVDTVNIFA